MGCDFIVESKGHCFICLQEISSQLDIQDDKSDHGSNTHTVIPSTSCLQSLSRYLGMELGKAFHQVTDALVPLQLLEGNQNLKLRSKLCEQCELLNANFDTLYRQLEKIQIEVTASLHQIFERLLKGKEANKFERLGRLPETNSSAGGHGELVILEALRAEALERCLRKLSFAHPRVKVQKLSLGGNGNATKLSYLNCGDPEVGLINSEPELAEVITVKLEYPSENTIQSDKDEDDNYYPDADMNTFTDSPGSDSETETKQNKKAKSGTRKAVNRELDIDFSPTNIPNGKIPESTLNPQAGKYKCRLCSSEFRTVKSHNWHCRVTHLNVKNKCDICGKEFKYKHSLRIHHSHAHMGVSFPCQICGIKFSRKYNLKQHQQLGNCKVGITDKKHICNCQICGKGFTLERHLKTHLEEVHSNCREHACARCGLEFKRKTHLRRHERNVKCRQK